MIAVEKKALRQRMIALRDALDVGERTALSARICTAVERLIQERNVRVLHSFLPMGSEVELFPLLDHAVVNGITVYAPKSLKGRVLENHRYHSRDQLLPGIFGTHYPADPTPYPGTYDMIIVPGLAFTSNGDRLGYGAGYYDTFLAMHPTAFTVAVCFPFQLLETLPVEDHDHSVDLVITG